MKKNLDKQITFSIKRTIGGPFATELGVVIVKLRNSAIQ